jgi:hypothetical protein
MCVRLRFHGLFPRQQFQTNECEDENEIEQQMATRADLPYFWGGNRNFVRGGASNQSSRRAHPLGNRLEPPTRIIFSSA